MQKLEVEGAECKSEARSQKSRLGTKCGQEAEREERKGKVVSVKDKARGKAEVLKCTKEEREWRRWGGRVPVRSPTPDPRPPIPDPRPLSSVPVFDLEREVEPGLLPSNHALVVLAAPQSD